MILRRLLLYIFLYFLTPSLFSQSVDWLFTIGSLGRDQIASSTGDLNGNIYVTGRFQGIVDFDQSSGFFPLQSNGGSDIFIAKYTSQGSFVWAISIGGSSTIDLGRDLVVDPSGNVYLAGIFENQVDFDPDPNSTFTLTANSKDAFLMKLSSSGNFVWARQFGGSNDEEPRSVVIDNAGNIFMNGYFNGGLTYPFQGSTSTLTSAGSNDVFMTKVDPNGNVLWLNRIGGTGNDISTFIDVDAANDLYICGDFRNSVDFDPTASSSIRSSNGSFDVFVAKYDTSGQLIWVQSVGGSSAEYSTSINAYNNSFIVVGGYYGSSSVDFNPGSGVSSRGSNGNDDAFLLSLTTNGTFRWVESYGGSSKEVVSSVITDKWGNVYSTGYFLGSANFNPGGTPQTLASTSVTDTYIMKLDSLGDFEWLGHLRGNSEITPSRFSFSGPNNIIIPGSFEQTADLDPTSNVQNFTSNGSRDYFIMSLNQCERTTDSISLFSCSPVVSPSGNYVWNSSGIFLDTIQNSVGCDSIITVNLTLDSVRTPPVQVVNSCGPFVSPSGNYTWTNSGVYTDTLSTALGCDSILTIDLRVNSSTSFSFSTTACDQYRAPSGKIVNSNGLFFDTIPNSSGCDSLLTIFLTLDSSSTSSQNVTACNQYISPTNNIYTTSGTYYDTLSNSQSCDSVITTQLTIQNLNLQIIQIGSQLISAQNGVTYQWLDCNANYSPILGATNQSFTPTVSGDYAVALDNFNCADTSICYNVLIIGLDEQDLESNFKIYPNPSSDYLFIESDFSIQRITIYDNSGRSQRMYLQNNNRLDLSAFAEGIYFIQIESDKGVYRKKVLVNR